MVENASEGETNPPKGKTRKTAPRRALDPWDWEARRVIRLELLRAEQTPATLAKLLADSGYGKNTEKALAQRIVRGSFTFAFALRVLATLGVETLDISYVRTHKKPKGTQP
jgi:hypothetical protein